MNERKVSEYTENVKAPTDKTFICYRHLFVVDIYLLCTICYRNKMLSTTKKRGTQGELETTTRLILSCRQQSSFH